MEIAKTKIMAFGTFDILHKGHYSFFKQARKLAKNPYLIVSIARDVNVNRIKGHYPRKNEKARLKDVKSCSLVDKVVLGGVKNYLNHIVKENPKIIALGYDQNAYVAGLKRSLLSMGLRVKILRLKPFKPKTYKSSLMAL